MERASESLNQRHEMGIKTTHDIPRNVAIDIISKKLLGNVSNSELADMLESFPESEFRNYSVYDDKYADAGVIYREFAILSPDQF